MSTILCIFDGFGLLPDSQNNCISQAKMPHFRSLLKDYYWTTLNADGVNVGQEEGLVGNSEVGHMNLGGLQLVSQLSYQITQSSINDFKLDHKIAIDQIFDPAIRLKGNDTVHLVGLFSTGTIHSDMRHWVAAIKSANTAKVTNIILHLITDGRDSDRTSFIESIAKFKNLVPKELLSKVLLGSYGGRAYAMDRDNNFEKVYYGLQAMFGPELISNTAKLREAFDITSYKEAKFENKAINLNSFETELKDSVTLEYANNTFDEFLAPCGYIPIKEGEPIWLINFRADRMRQIVKMLDDYNFDNQHLIIAMNDYGDDDGYECIFRSQPVSNNLAYYIAKDGKTQLHTAETEKYNHVTYFFNGGQDIKQSGEKWTLIPSNKLQNHSEKPEMKAKEVTDTVIDAMGKFDYIIVNYANPDMVAHCGDIDAGIESMEFLDAQLGRLLDKIKTTNSKMILTADHGNMEFVGGYTREGKELTDTEHNSSPVPLIIVDSNFDKEIFMKKLNQYSEFDIDLDLLKKCLSEENQIEFPTTNDWLKKSDIPSSRLPLWYAGLFAFILGKK
jgi:2,3-bisphosphoglycerate-independent phosphoglycerate mutase